MSYPSYRSSLCEIFSNKSVETIDNIIRIVEENSDENFEGKLESMINLLSFTGNPDKEGTSNCNISLLSSIYDDTDDVLLDEAAGWDLSHGDRLKQGKTELFFMKLKELLPDADPSYLQQKVAEVTNEEDLKAFIDHAFEEKDYPTIDDYLKRQKEKSERQNYTSKFHLYEFLKEFPDPLAYFQLPNRNHSLSQENKNKDNKNDETFNEEKDYALTFLYNQFPKLRQRDIMKVFTMYKYDLVKSAMRCGKLMSAFREPRRVLPQEDDLKTNILLLKEIAFVKHMNEIRRVMNAQKENLENARRLGRLQTCTICYFTELIPEECYICSKGCIFCRDCIKQGVELAVSEENLAMGCLMNCGGDYSLTTLQMVLDRKTFERFWLKKQLHEVEKAQIDGVEFCCLCYNYAYIPNPEDKIFSCNACNKESCRKCKHESHLPLRCNEVEYDEDVRIRTFIENQMTAALVRKCFKCGKQYIKSTGCNKIQCDCGALMCYLCHQPVTGYEHFNQQKCQLFTDDNVLHLENVKEGARKAKVELGVDKNPEMLKFDPAKDL